jgi:hypothetical protein
MFPKNLNLNAIGRFEFSIDEPGLTLAPCRDSFGVHIF